MRCLLLLFAIVVAINAVSSYTKTFCISLTNSTIFSLFFSQYRLYTIHTHMLFIHHIPKSQIHSMWIITVELSTIIHNIHTIKHGHIKLLYGQ